MGDDPCWDDPVHRLWPLPAGPLDDAALAAHYAYPDANPDDLDAPFVRVNFVSSVDGAATVDGLSGGLGSDADRRVFGLFRVLADVVLVGAGTVRAEDYRGARRPTRGRDSPPPIAVLTGSADIDPGSRLLTDTAVAPIILTGPDAPAARRAALATAGAEVVVLDPLDVTSAIGELGHRGLPRVLCEGGPTLLGHLTAADAVDELCLTVAPLLTGGSAGRISRGDPARPPRRMTLVGALHAPDALLLRYGRTATSDMRHVDPPNG